MDYCCLPAKKYTYQGYHLVSVRVQDILLIKEWRNQQIVLLRQQAMLTDEEQQHYYGSVVFPEFIREQPRQILLSYLHDDVCVGYGGLVHIDWQSMRAEVSFLLNPAFIHDTDVYAMFFRNFLELLKHIAFNELLLNRLYTETYELEHRQHHINVLEQSGFAREGRLIQQVKIDGKFTDSLLHGLVKENYNV